MCSNMINLPYRQVMAKAMEAEEHPTLPLLGELMGNNLDIVRVWGLMKILGLLLRCVELLKLLFASDFGIRPYWAVL